jgi:hypothetical protein
MADVFIEENRLFISFRNSPSGKQYIDNAKHKLIMRISLESIDLAAGKLTFNDLP